MAANDREILRLRSIAQTTKPIDAYLAIERAGHDAFKAGKPWTGYPAETRTICNDEGKGMWTSHIWLEGYHAAESDHNAAKVRR